MTAYQAEAEDNARLARAREELAKYRNAENEARKALALAVESTRKAKEKHDALFEECQKRAVDRRKAGLIVNNPGY